MPTICHFYGITIVMYLRNKEHNPPHIHAITQDFAAPFSIAAGELMDGEFPPKAQALVKEFISCIRLSFWRCGRRSSIRSCRRSDNKRSQDQGGKMNVS